MTTLPVQTQVAAINNPPGAGLYPPGASAGNRVVNGKAVNIETATAAIHQLT